MKKKMSSQVIRELHILFMPIPIFRRHRMFRVE